MPCIIYEEDFMKNIAWIVNDSKLLDTHALGWLKNEVLENFKNILIDEVSITSIQDLKKIYDGIFIFYYENNSDISLESLIDYVSLSKFWKLIFFY